MLSQVVAAIRINGVVFVYITAHFLLPADQLNVQNSQTILMKKCDVVDDVIWLLSVLAECRPYVSSFLLILSLVDFPIA